MTIPIQIDIGNLAVGIGTCLVALATLISLRKGRSQRIADYRRDWIENLQSHMAAFLRVASDIGMTEILPKTSDALKQKNALSESGSYSVQNMVELKHESQHIKLLLKEEREEHRRLVELIDNLISNPSTQSISDTADQCRLVLKKEWARLENEM